jgi:hypothetical protein
MQNTVSTTRSTDTVATVAATEISAEAIAATAAVVAATPFDAPRPRRIGTTVKRKGGGMVSRFNHIGARPGWKHAKCVDKLGVTFFPANNVAFTSDMVPLENLRVLVVSGRYHADGTPSMPIATFSARIDDVTGQVHYDASGHERLYDASLRRAAASHPLKLHVAQNRPLAKLTVALAESIELCCESRFLELAPKMPGIMFAADPIRPLRPELGNPYLIQAARELHSLGAAGVPTVEHRMAAFHDSAVQHGGLTCYPQEFFLRATQPNSYAVHPTTRSSRPALGEDLPADRTISDDGDWVFDGASWEPLAQVPRRAYAVLDARLLGRAHRNPAFSVLKKHGVLPADADYTTADSDRDIWVTQAYSAIRLGVLDALQTVCDAYNEVSDVADITDEMVAAEDGKVLTEHLPAIASHVREQLRNDADTVPGEAYDRMGIEDEDVMACARDPRQPLRVASAMLNLMRERVGGPADRCSDAAMHDAVMNPMADLTADLEPSLQIVQLSGPASTEVAAFSGPQGHAWLNDFSEPLEAKLANA